MKTISERLIQLREDNNLTKIEMSKKLGINKSAITRYELGEYKPTLDVMIKIHDVFGISLDWLAGFDVDEVRKYDPIIRECIDANIPVERLKKAIELLKG